MSPLVLIFMENHLNPSDLSPQASSAAVLVTSTHKLDVQFLQTKFHLVKFVSFLFCTCCCSLAINAIKKLC